MLSTQLITFCFNGTNASGIGGGARAEDPACRHKWKPSFSYAKRAGVSAATLQREMQRLFDGVCCGTARSVAPR
jgi:hypothetical protein